MNIRQITSSHPANAAYMELVMETPPKRQKIGHTQDTVSLDSDRESDGETARTYETVETVPLPARYPKGQKIGLETGLFTQESQVGEHSAKSKGTCGIDGSTVQIEASSPHSHSISGPPREVSGMAGKALSSSIAPAGTVFRPPPGIIPVPIIKKTHPLVTEISEDDDGPQYHGGSSDDDSQFPRADIKPANFTTSSNQCEGMSALERFKLITSSAKYDFEPSVKSQHGPDSNGHVANAYGGDRPAIGRTTVPRANVEIDKKLLTSGDITLDDVQDYQTRHIVVKMHQILPQRTLRQCWDALRQKKGNFDDAMDLLCIAQDPEVFIDLTNEGGVDSAVAQGGRQTSSPRVPAKQQIREPIQSIREKWAGQQTISHQRISHPKPMPQARRRLVKRYQESDKRAATSSTPSTHRRGPHTDSEDSASDASSHQEDDSGRPNEIAKLLDFFNTCSSSDLSDSAAIDEQTADTVLDHRPFPSLEAICRVTVEQVAKGKRRSKARPIGDKVVRKCSEMFRGYEAIDQLVHRCEELSKPLKNAIAEWGVSIQGSNSRIGEIDVVHLEKVGECSKKDSGIGTPASRDPSDDEEISSSSAQSNKVRKPNALFPQPSMLSADVQLKDYQLLGVNWLSLLFDEGLSCILADDMGLGKTCQVIAFLAHLAEQNIMGPHLIIVPGSTLENWLREFSVFCPKLSVIPYYAGQTERLGLREEIEDNREATNVIITTYTIAKIKEDNKFLRKMKPVCCIYDEGHMLRNSKSAGYEAYMRIQAKFRLLLTGTPLQNNLTELISLLGFILPSVFNDHKEELEVIFSHKAKTDDKGESRAALLSQERIRRAKSMMTPFVLRRKKHQVLEHLPPKVRKIEYCELSPAQRQLYNQEKERAALIFARRKAGDATATESANTMMSLRKASIHPLLFRRLYNDDRLKDIAKACLIEKEFHSSEYELVYEDMTVMDDIELHRFCEMYPKSVGGFALQNEEWMGSGKVHILRKLLVDYQKNGDRVLIFSQFVLVMNILELVLETLGVSFYRLDGQTKIDERQTLIDEFHKNSAVTAFLLSTKAGGAGINLACANKVVIFDSSFNPQDDIQAENRAHRVGQSREVEVIRLVAKDTIEEQIYALGETKLALDERVAGEHDMTAAEDQGRKLVEEMLLRAS